jgi:transcription elongation factor Elf1
MTMFWVIFVGVIVFGAVINLKKQSAPPNPMLICPHCNTQGQVRTFATKAKRGVSGGKATGALLTGGVSLLATGLSRKERVTRATCLHCGSRWTF